MLNISILLLIFACKPVTVLNDTAPPITESSDSGDTEVETTPDIEVDLHDDVDTVLVVSWVEEQDVELSWIEYQFEDTEMSTPPIMRVAGEQSAVLLGIPPITEVTLQIFSQTGEDITQSKVVTTQTGALPGDLPAPSLVSYDSSLASPEGWVLISVDTSDPGEWYQGPFYIIILDRQGRVVWYYSIPDRRVSMFPRVALDGTHLLFDESTAYFSTASTSRLHRLSLDFSYDETIDVEGLVYGYTELAEGGFIRDKGGWGGYSLIEQDVSGEERVIWDCNTWLSANYPHNGLCYSNAVNYSPETNSVLWSLPYHDTVVEIDRDSGEVLRVFGDVAPTHEIVPSDASFDFQHYPNYTPDGTLLVSMHIEGTTDQQRAREYTVNDETGELIEIWFYGADVDEYAYYSGEAWRLANGNTLMNYGTGGAAREVTPDKQVVWDIAFPDRHLNGHISLFDDIYALLGPE